MARSHRGRSARRVARAARVEPHAGRARPRARLRQRRRRARARAQRLPGHRRRHLGDSRRAREASRAVFVSADFLELRAAAQASFDACVVLLRLQPRSARAPSGPHARRSTAGSSRAAGSCTHSAQSDTEAMDGRRGSTTLRRSSRAIPPEVNSRLVREAGFEIAARRARRLRGAGRPGEVPMGACAFDLTHYRELLDAARAGGYEWASFDRHPRAGDLYLRHDVDLSLEAALEMARIEHELGVRATYFLMTESGFYNLDSHARPLRAAAAPQLGPRRRPARRLSARRARRALRQGRRLAQPRPRVHVAADRRRRQRHGGAVLHEGPLPLRLEPRTGARAARTTSSRAGAFEWLQLLVHPEIWVYDGATMRETHGVDARREARRVARLTLAADRIDLS